MVEHADEVNHAEYVKRADQVTKRTGWDGMTMLFKVLFVGTCVLLALSLVLIPVLSWNQSRSNNDLLNRTTGDDSHIVMNQRVIEQENRDIIANQEQLCSIIPRCNLANLKGGVAAG